MKIFVFLLCTALVAAAFADSSSEEKKSKKNRQVLVRRLEEKLQLVRIELGELKVRLGRIQYRIDTAPTLEAQQKIRLSASLVRREIARLEQARIIIERDLEQLRKKKSKRSSSESNES